MKRDELIRKLLAQIEDETCDPDDLTVNMIETALDAISQAGFAIVPGWADAAMVEAGKAALRENGAELVNSAGVEASHRAMIKAYEASDE